MQDSETLDLQITAASASYALLTEQSISKLLRYFCSFPTCLNQSFVSRI